MYLKDMGPRTGYGTFETVSQYSFSIFMLFDTLMTADNTNTSMHKLQF